MTLDPGLFHYLYCDFLKRDKRHQIPSTFKKENNQLDSKYQKCVNEEKILCDKIYKFALNNLTYNFEKDARVLIYFKYHLNVAYHVRALIVLIVRTLSLILFCQQHGPF